MPKATTEGYIQGKTYYTITDYTGGFLAICESKEAVSELLNKVNLARTSFMVRSFTNLTSKEDFEQCFSSKLVWKFLGIAEDKTLRIISGEAAPCTHLDLTLLNRVVKDMLFTDSTNRYYVRVVASSWLEAVNKVNEIISKDFNTNLTSDISADIAAASQ